MNYIDTKPKLLRADSAFQTHRAKKLETIRVQTRKRGFSGVSPHLVTDQASNADKCDLLAACEKMPNDTYVNTGSKNPRTLGGFLVFPFTRKVIPYPGLLLENGMAVTPFNIGNANPTADGTRLFQVPSAEIAENRFLHDMIRTAVAIDPTADELAKNSIYYCQVFLQGSEVDLNTPRANAAPPPFAHKDNCRFKYVVLIGRHNILGGESVLLPIEKLGEVTKDGAFEVFDLQVPGEGYAFIDEAPDASECRPDNCHYATDLQLGKNGSTGYRIVATITAAPLIFGRGDASESASSMKNAASMAWPFLYGPDAVHNMDNSELQAWIDRQVVAN